MSYENSEMILDGQFCETTIGCEDRELGVLFKSMFQTPNFRVSTGCFKANVYTLTNDCDKYSMCSEKIMVDLLLVYPEISFDNNKS